MSNFKVTGTIKEFLEVKSGISKATDKEWKKQIFIVTNNDGYNGNEMLYAFEVFGAEKVENLTKYNKVGDVVDVTFNVKCNEYNGNYYTSLGAWNIKKSEAVAEPEAHPVENENEAVDDLSF